MQALPLFLEAAGRPILVLGTGEAADAKRRLVEEAGGVPTTDENVTRIAFIATDMPEADAARLKASGYLVNVVDRPDLCDFTIPAILDRTPLTIAIGTSGASASLSKALKERLDLLLPPGLGPLATAIRASRAAVARVHPSVPARRAFWSRLLSAGAPLDPLAPPADPAAAITAALAEEAAPPPPPRTIRASHEDDLTLPDLRALAAADLAVAPPGIHPTILAHIRRDAARTAVAPPPGFTGRLVILEPAP
jgi:uroporphyrin-III C-methyltransferase/precorrin-2 dehydrogenase/sirohydrochlorin ferrochelatase